MGVLTPIAVRIGAVPWMPRLLPAIEATDMRLQKLTRHRVSLLDIAGLPNLVLQVRGRRTGILRSIPLLCAPTADSWLIAGSYFGNPSVPTWAVNLRAARAADILVSGASLSVTARELAGDERAAAWATLVDVWPNFELYERRTERTIPLFELTARGSSRTT